MRRHRGTLALAAMGVCLATAPQALAEGSGTSFRSDGSAVLENSLVELTTSGRAGGREGIRGWRFKPTEHEMIDVLYGQTDWLRGHVFGEFQDPVKMLGYQAGRHDLGALLVPVAYGRSKDGSAVMLIQRSEGACRLTKTTILRRDHAVVEVRFSIEKLSGVPVAASMRFHSIMSPGGRTGYHAKAGNVYLPGPEGALELDYSLTRVDFKKAYGQECFVLPKYRDGPQDRFGRGRFKEPSLRGTWAALVQGAHGDGIVFSFEEATFVGFYVCNGITIEPMMDVAALSPGEKWECRAFFGSFTGAKDRKILDVTPLYCVTRELKVEDGKLTGEVLPLFRGELRIEDRNGQTVAKAPADPTRPALLEGAVGAAEASGKLWRIVAVDTSGAVLGSVDSQGNVEMSRPEIDPIDHARPEVKDEVYVPKDAEAEIEDFLTPRDFVVYCAWEDRDDVKELSEKIARRLGVGHMWTAPGKQKVLVVGNVGVNSLIRDAGMLRHSISAEWPGSGKGAILPYDNFEGTESPILFVAGSDRAGAVRTAEHFFEQYLSKLPAPKGLKLWVAGTHRKVFPSATVEKGAGKVELEMARGEYESAQLAITAYEDLTNVKVTVEPLRHVETGKTLDEMRLRYLTRHRQLLPKPWLRWVGQFPVEPKNGWTGIPDPLFERPVTQIPAGRTQALWLTVFIPETAPAGTYRTSVTCESGNLSQSIPVEVQVWNFTLPHEGILGEPYHDFQFLSPDGRRELLHWMVAPLVQNFVEHGMRVLHLGPSDMFRWHFTPEGTFKGLKHPAFTVSEDGKVALDSARFDWLVELCDQTAKPFQLRYMLYSRPLLDGFGDFRKALPDRFKEVPTDSGQALSYPEEMFRLFEQHLADKGWTGRFMLKVGDEPGGYDKWAEIENVIAARRAGVPVMTCFNAIDWKEAEAGLGKMAVWMPLYQLHDPEFFRKARAAGDLISWYNCGPKPRINAGADHSEIRGYLWQAAKADLDIICWWGIQNWRQGTTHCWNSRYSHHNSLVWPDHPEKPKWREKGRTRDGAPIDGLRWELVREGLEDTRYVTLLRSRIAEAREAGRTEAADKAQAVLDGIWKEVFPSLNDYAPPYEKFFESRRKIAEAILALPERTKE